MIKEKNLIKFKPYSDYGLTGNWRTYIQTKRLYPNKYVLRKHFANQTEQSSTLNMDASWIFVYRQMYTHTIGIAECKL